MILGANSNLHIHQTFCSGQMLCNPRIWHFYKRGMIYVLESQFFVVVVVVFNDFSEDSFVPFL